MYSKYFLSNRTQQKGVYLGSVQKRQNWHTLEFFFVKAQTPSSPLMREQLKTPLLRIPTSASQPYCVLDQWTGPSQLAGSAMEPRASWNGSRNSSNDIFVMENTAARGNVLEEDAPRTPGSLRPDGSIPATWPPAHSSSFTTCHASLPTFSTLRPHCSSSILVPTRFACSLASGALQGLIPPSVSAPPMLLHSTLCKHTHP